MRKIIALNHVTLDGIIQSGGGPEEDSTGGFAYGGWTVPFRSADAGAAVGELMARGFDLLLGAAPTRFGRRSGPLPAIIPSRTPSTRQRNTSSQTASTDLTG